MILRQYISAVLQVFLALSFDFLTITFYYLSSKRSKILMYSANARERKLDLDAFFWYQTL